MRIRIPSNRPPPIQRMKKKWTDLLSDRHLTSHSYDEATAARKSYLIRVSDGFDLKTTGSIRTVAIPPFCAELLKRYRRAQKEERIELGDQRIDEGWIFTQWNGAPMYPTPTAWFSDFLKRHDLPHRKFHALRHTSATLLLINGSDIKTVGSRLGHRK